MKILLQNDQKHFKNICNNELNYELVNYVAMQNKINEWTLTSNVRSDATQLIKLIEKQLITRHMMHFLY